MNLMLPGDLFQMDDDWEPAVGEWFETNNAKFPRGLKHLADKIHSAGLWLASFVCRNGSGLMTLVRGDTMNFLFWTILSE